MDKKYTTIDGNTACSNIAYKLTDMAIIYPITPSSPMAENYDSLGAKGKINVFGNVPKVTEMQSEAGAAGALHGALSSGSLATTFTSSQGLLLMIPNMYKIAGEGLPAVIHVAARTIATHALSIFGDHSDIYATRQTGFSMIASSSVQEAQDMALISHLVAVCSKIPVLHFFDGFRTSHEISKIEELSDETIKKLVDFNACLKFKSTALNPLTPTERGTAQNEDVFFQAREAGNIKYSEFKKHIKNVFSAFSAETGRKYGIFEYYGDKNAEFIIVSMGSSITTIKETIKYLNNQGLKVGAINVRLYRPFYSEEFVKLLPPSVKTITVLDRTKEDGASFEPLALDVSSALMEHGLTNIKVLGGRYGLSSKEFTPSHVYSVVLNMMAKRPKNHFSVGINDDLTNNSLPESKHINLIPKDVISCKFFGLGSDGTVSANKSTIKILGEQTNLDAQGYFVYDSKKSGSLTVSHLRFGKSKINAPYLIDSPDFVACHNTAFLTKLDVLEGIKQNGTLLLNCPYKTEEDFIKAMPISLRKTILSKNLRVFAIDAEKIAENVGLNRRINLIMQTCFFKLSGLLKEEKAISLIKEMAKKSYASKGEKVLNMNMQAIDQSLGNLFELKYSSNFAAENSKPNLACANECKNCTSACQKAFYENIMQKIEQKKGNDIPVSMLNSNGEVPVGTSALEKRNTATNLPYWKSENCIQCNMCALVCPHAVIRPYLIKNEEKIAPDCVKVPALGVPGYSFCVQISPADCTGCSVCANVCPAKNKALEMRPASEIYANELKKYNQIKNVVNPQTSFPLASIKGSQFKKPLFEFSGACAGCGETPYIKLLTSLFGENIVIANATGCSSIYSGSFPSCPYTTSEKGMGPAWSNSLFEDNAEFGLGMHKAQKENRKQLESLVNAAIENKALSPALIKLFKEWQQQEKKDNNLAIEIVSRLNKEAETNMVAKNLLYFKGSLVDSTTWIIGGDGWAYDIGFGGLDHVLSTGENVKVLVLDTEVYSNTGGQASKATPMGAIAKFAASGKTTQKKDLGAIARNYPNTYVAQVSLGANMQATINAFAEAQNHNGPAIIIAYCPCINHGTDMSKSIEQEKLAVESGYFNIYRFNPTKTPSLVIDYPVLTKPYSEFLNSQSRYFTLAKQNPERATVLFTSAESYAKRRIENLKKLSAN